MNTRLTRFPVNTQKANGFLQRPVIVGIHVFDPLTTLEVIDGGVGVKSILLIDWERVFASGGDVQHIECISDTVNPFAPEPVFHKDMITCTVVSELHRSLLKRALHASFPFGFGNHALITMAGKPGFVIELVFSRRGDFPEVTFTWFGRDRGIRDNSFILGRQIPTSISGLIGVVVNPTRLAFIRVECLRFCFFLHSNRFLANSGSWWKRP